MKKSCKYTSIGGSALIEGVMMRGNDKMAIAVRRANGNIVLKVEAAPASKAFYTKIPVLRGVISFIMSMITSYKAIMYSADVSMEDIAEQEQTEIKPGFTKFLTIASVVLGLLLGVACFIYLPTLVTDLFSKYVIELSGFAKRLATGIFKMLIFIVYMLLVSRMEDMRRVFMYHGAEHKTIFCYEAGAQLTPENIKEHTRFHPRCGTSFIVIVLIVSLFVSMIIPWKTALLHSVLKLLFLPAVMGIAYEFIKLAGRCDNWFTRIISAPGLWTQRITTREPDESMLEVAALAMEGVISDMPFGEHEIEKKQ